MGTDSGYDIGWDMINVRTHPNNSKQFFYSSTATDCDDGVLLQWFGLSFVALLPPRGWGASPQNMRDQVQYYCVVITDVAYLSILCFFYVLVIFEFPPARERGLFSLRENRYDVQLYSNYWNIPEKIDHAIIRNITICHAK